jgi:hypothetical protein
MRLGRGLLVCALACSSAVSVRADSISLSDPRIVIVRGFLLGTPFTTINSIPLTVSSNGGGVFRFTNETSQLVSLKITVRSLKLSAANVTCSESGFSGSGCIAMGQNMVTIVFNGSIPSCPPPFTNCRLSEFSINLNDLHGNNGNFGSWKGDTIMVTPILVSTPDATPGATLLLVAGSLGGGIWLRRKWGFHKYLV